MKPTWRIEDLIDLEYFLEQDEISDDDAISHRDREVFLKDVVPKLKYNELSDKTDRKTAIRIWLESRRKIVSSSGEKHSALPGRLFADMMSFVSILILIIGILTGTGLAFTLLQYQGSEPVNVSTYLGIFVLLQIVLIGILAIFSLFRRFIRSLRYFSLIQLIFGTLLAGLFRKIAARTKNALSVEKRNRFSSIVGMIKGQKQLYGSVFYWPVFMLAQIIGIGFNLGVLGGSLLRIIGADLAFGWQSTIQFSSRAVYLFVKTMAIPWSLFISPPLAHPTYEQIDGSRMVLKEGIYHLTTPDLVSWWPFLLLAVCFYGFLPRIILLIGSMIAKKSALAKIDLNHVPCNRLLRRMTTPRVETLGQTQVNLERIPSENQNTNHLAPTQKPSALPGQEVWGLIPDDIADYLSVEDLNAIIKHMPGISLKQRIDISFDFEKDQETLELMTDKDSDDNGPMVLLLQEGWLPPISETFLYLRELREMLGTKALIHIFLIGKPTPDNAFTPVDTRDWQIWKQAIQKRSDPFLEINGLRNSK